MAAPWVGPREPGGAARGSGGRTEGSVPGAVQSQRGSAGERDSCF